MGEQTQPSKLKKTAHAVNFFGRAQHKRKNTMRLDLPGHAMFGQGSLATQKLGGLGDLELRLGRPWTDQGSLESCGLRAQHEDLFTRNLLCATNSSELSAPFAPL